jgi:ATP-dependent helicase HrpB
MHLPADDLLPSLRSHLLKRPAALVVAPPGSGKTTRIPPGLLGNVGGRVLVLQPRRAAARMVARRMASELGEEVGQTVGYHVRFDRRAGKKTRLEVLTEGLLLKRMQADPFLEGVGAVILDEFHERSLFTDICLALLREVQKEARPELKLILMSATIDPAPVLSYFHGDCSLLRSGGSLHPVGISYDERTGKGPVHAECAARIRREIEKGGCGNILAFLPGAWEIGNVQERLSSLRGFEVFPLHGRLTPQEQDRAMEPSGGQRIILATNIAETSVTIPGVGLVIDSGLHRVSHSRDGEQQLRTERISLDCADQRAGRAGRTAAGRCHRMWTWNEHQRLARQRQPEIMRSDLAWTILQLHAWGTDPAQSLWFDPPPASRMEEGTSLLHRLGALENGRPTEAGRRMAGLPLHPRLARMLLLAKELGAGASAAALAALVSEGDPWRDDAGDALEKAGRIMEGRCPGRHARAWKQLCRQLGIKGGVDHSDESVLRAFAAGFPDWVGKRREGSRAYLLADGSEAILDGDGHAPDFIVAGQLGRSGRGRRRIRLAAEVDPAWLPSSERRVHRFDEAGERVVCIRQRLAGGLLINEQNEPPSRAEAEELLLEAAEKSPIRALQPSKEDSRLQDRIRFVARALPELGIQGGWKQALPQLCAGRRSFAELRKADLAKELRSMLSWKQIRALEEHAPESIQAPSGTWIQIQYPSEGPPVLAARIQQLFGMEQSPLIGGEPAMVHLLAPNNRPQQQTRDLASFWATAYPQVRKELRGRYPKHAWPESPAAKDAEDRPARKRRH